MVNGRAQHQSETRFPATDKQSGLRVEWVWFDARIALWKYKKPGDKKTRFWHNIVKKTAQKKQLNPENIDAMSKDEVVSFLLEQQARNDELEAKLAAMQQLFKKMADQHFGKKSEKTKVLKDQMSLMFDEVEVSASSDEELEADHVDEDVSVIRKNS